MLTQNRKWNNKISAKNDSKSHNREILYRWLTLTFVDKNKYSPLVTMNELIVSFDNVIKITFKVIHVLGV